VHWSIDGAERLLQQGHYTVPASAVALKDEWKQKADPAYCFVAEELDEPKTEGEWSKLDTLYELYVAWSSATGRKQMAANTFGYRLKHWKRRKNDANYYALAPKQKDERIQRERRNQAVADEAFAEEPVDEQPGEPLELDPDEERRTDLYAKQAAERWAGSN
jgi:phage/plasmid-associated DNA primase